MRKHTYWIIIVVVLLLVAVVLVLTTSNTTLHSKTTQFAVEDTSGIVKIFLTDKQNNQITLHKDESSEWTVNDEHKASKYKVESLLKTMKDLKVLAPVSKVSHNTVVSRLAAKSVKVEIYQMVPRINIFNWIQLFPHEKITKTYYVGGATKDNLGTYMLMENASTPYITYLPMFRGFLTPRYSTTEEDWRDHTVFSHPLENIKSIKLEFPQEPENSYEVFNLDNLSFDLYDIQNKDRVKNFDTLRMLGFMTAFKNIKFEALLTYKRPDAFIDSVKNSQPLHILTLIDINDDTTQVTTFPKKGFSELMNEDGYVMEPYDLDRMYALVNRDRDFVLIQFFVFDKVLRPLSYFKKN